MRVITLTGPKRSGKNTMADLVGEELGALGVELRQAAFADPLRWAGDAIGLPAAATRELKDQPCAELGGHTGREFLIEFGATCVRVAAEDARHVPRPGLGGADHGRRSATSSSRSELPAWRGVSVILVSL